MEGSTGKDTASNGSNGDTAMGHSAAHNSSQQLLPPLSPYGALAGASQALRSCQSARDQIVKDFEVELNETEGRPSSSPNRRHTEKALPLSPLQLAKSPNRTLRLGPIQHGAPNRPPLLIAQRKDASPALSQRFPECCDHQKELERLRAQLSMIQTGEVSNTDQSINQKMNHKNTELQALQKQLMKEKEEFDLLTEALEEKDILIASQQTELEELRSRCEATESSERASQEGEAARDLRMKKAPHESGKKGTPSKGISHVDACVSPRSFKENQLIRLRDEALEAKNKEVWLLSGRADRLSAQVDQLENELKKFQSLLMEKESVIYGLEQTVEREQSNARKLRELLESAQAHERTVQVTTKQNEQLLCLLQKQEAQSEDLQEQLFCASEEAEGWKGKYQTLLTKIAETEAEETVKARRDENRERAREEKMTKILKENDKLRADLMSYMEKAQNDAREMQDELSQRREKYYMLLDKLQGAEEAHRNAQDDAEGLKSQLEQVRDHLDVVSERLRNTKAEKVALEEQLQWMQKTMNLEKAQLQGEKLALESDKNALQRQLQEMSSTVSSIAGRHNDSQGEIMRERARASERQLEIEELRRRLLAVVQQTNQQGAEKVEVESQLTMVQHQLDEVRSALSERIGILTEQANIAKESEAQTKMRLLRKTEAVEELGTAKHKMILKILDMLRRNPRPEVVTLMSSKLGEDAVSVLCPQKSIGAADPQTQYEELRVDFADCVLSPFDLSVILQQTGSLESPWLLDLQANKLNDEAIEPITDFLVNSAYDASFSIDLRMNRVSFDGIRGLAAAIAFKQSNTRSRRNELFVDTEGLITARVVVGQNGSDVERNLVIDVRQNLSEHITEEQLLQVSSRALLESYLLRRRISSAATTQQIKERTQIPKASRNQADELKEESQAKTRVGALRSSSKTKTMSYSSAPAAAKAYRAQQQPD